MHVARSRLLVTRSRPLVALLLLGVLLILLLAAVSTAAAAPRSLIMDNTAVPSWSRLIAGPAAGADSAADVLLLGGGVSLVSGTISNASGSTDVSLTKYRDGVLQWTQTWNGPGNGADSQLALSPADKMVLSPDGKYVYQCCTGVKAGANLDLYVVKRKVSSGNLVWAKRYDGPAHKNEIAVAIGIDGKGNIVAACASANAADADYAVASWKPSGAARWTWRWDGKNGADMPFDLVVTPAGDAYVTGAGVAGGGKIQAITARLSSTGKQLFLKKYLGDTGLGAGMSSLALRPGGGVYVGGWVTSAVGDNDAAIVKYTPKGGRSTVSVDNAGGGATNDMYWDIAVLSTKAIVGAGYAATGAVQQPHVAVYTPSGTPLFNGTKPTAGSDTFTACAVDAFGGWYATAAIHEAPAVTRVWTYRSSVLASAGMWQCVHGGVASAEYGAAAIAVRDASCVVVGQAPSGGPTGTDQLVLMFNY